MSGGKPLLLGAHVSTAGGVSRAPARGAAIGATAIQIFTKTPSQWREPMIAPDEANAFRAALRASAIRAVVSHDSYLINVASPDPHLRQRSMLCLQGELRRCRTLGVRYVVTHPGNYIDDREAGLHRNAAAYAECLAAVPGPMLLVETTAGTGTSLGSTFEELARLRQLVPARLRRRIGFCADLCHLYSAGYDLVRDWSGVWRRWDRAVGLRRLRCFHLNDSKTPFGSRRDRHAWVGEGSLGPEPFRRLMRDRRFRDIIKVIETPKADDGLYHDRRMLRRLRRYATARGARQRNV